MKSRRILIAAMLVTLGVVVAILTADYLRAPRYHAKRLSWWLEDGERKSLQGGEKARRPAMDAVQHIGTNAIPTLLRMLRKTDSPLVLKWERLANRFEFIPRPLKADRENLLGARGIVRLGTNAANAIPELFGIYRKCVSLSSEEAAFYALRKVLPVSQLDALLQAGITNQHDTVRIQAYGHLTSTNTPQTSIPMLIKALSDPSPWVQRSMVLKLREFGTNALPAVPALLPLAMRGATNGSFTYARLSLIEIDAATAARVLTNGFYTYQYFTNQEALRESAARAIKKRETYLGNWKPAGSGNAEAAARFMAQYGLPPLGTSPPTSK